MDQIVGIKFLPPQEPPPPFELPPPTAEDLALLERIDRILAGQEPPSLMTTPPEVEEQLEALLASLAPVQVLPAERQRLADDLNLQYYHGGNEVLIWQTPQGRAVLAVGTEQVARVCDHLPQEQLFRLSVQFAEPWVRVE